MSNRFSLFKYGPFVFGLIVALIFSAAGPMSSVSAAPLSAGCTSKFAPTGTWPDGQPHTDGVHFCHNGSWLTRSEFVAQTGQSPESVFGGGQSSQQSSSQQDSSQQSAQPTQAVQSDQPIVDVPMNEFFPGEFSTSTEQERDTSRLIWKQVVVRNCIFFYCWDTQDNVLLPENVQPQVPYVTLQRALFEKAQCTDRMNVLYDPRALGGDMITWNCSKMGNVSESGFDVIDIATVTTLGTPWPGDEEVMGVVWVGKTAIKILLVAGSAYVTANTMVQASRVLPGPIHSDPVQHDPYIKGSLAYQIATLFIAEAMNLFQNPRDPKSKCGAWYNGANVLVRYVWWRYTHNSNNRAVGRLLWGFADTLRFGGGYSGKFADRLNNPLDSNAGADLTFRPMDCSRMPGLNTFAAP